MKVKYNKLIKYIEDMGAHPPRSQAQMFEDNDYHYNIGWTSACTTILNALSSFIKEEKISKWNISSNLIICSYCQNSNNIMSKYCPNCGKKMRNYKND